MNGIQRYLAEAAVADYADGLTGRLEALPRLALPGVAAATAAPLLAAGEADRPAETPATATSAASPTAAAAPSGSAPAGPPPLATQAITFVGPQGRQLQGAWAQATTPKGSELVIHENRGLTDHIRS